MLKQRRANLTLAPKAGSGPEPHWVGREGKLRHYLINHQCLSICLLVFCLLSPCPPHTGSPAFSLCLPLSVRPFLLSLFHLSKHHILKWWSGLRKQLHCYKRRRSDPKVDPKKGKCKGNCASAYCSFVLQVKWHWCQPLYFHSILAVILIVIQTCWSKLFWWSTWQFTCG